MTICWTGSIFFFNSFNWFRINSALIVVLNAIGDGIAGSGHWERFLEAMNTIPIEFSVLNETLSIKVRSFDSDRCVPKLIKSNHVKVLVKKKKKRIDSIKCIISIEPSLMWQKERRKSLVNLHNITLLKTLTGEIQFKLVYGFVEIFFLS